MNGCSSAFAVCMNLTEVDPLSRQCSVGGVRSTGSARSPLTVLARLDRAVAFLEQAQLPDGEFPSLVSTEPELRRRCAPDTNYFTTSQVLWSLSFVPGRPASSLARRAARFLAAGEESDGSWRFFTPKVVRRIDPDVDVTACAGATLRGRASRLGYDPDRTRSILLTACDEVGRFRTWIRKGPRNDLDSVANANVLWFLGNDPATNGCALWLQDLVESNTSLGTFPYYESPLALYHAIARAVFAGADQLACLRQRLADLILSMARVDGSFGNVLETAFAVCALHNLGVSGELSVRRAVVLLSRRQRRDGSWPALAAWNGPELPAPRSLWWGGACWTTALAMEALARFAYPKQSRPLQKPRSALVL